MKKPVLTVLRYAVPAAILVFGAWYVTAHFDIYLGRARFTLAGVSALVLLNIVTILCESIRLRMMIRKLGNDIGLPDSWRLMTLIQALNCVILKAGTASAGFYLSRRRGVPFNGYLAFVVTYVVVIVLAAGLFGLVLSLVFALAERPVSPAAPVFFAGVAGVSILTIAAARVRLPLACFPETLRRFFENIRIIYSDSRLLVVMTGLECIGHLASALRFMIAVGMLSGHADLLESAVIMTVGNFLRIATVVPGGLGVAEIASAWTAGMLGGNVGIAGLSSGMDRLVYIVLVFLSGGAGFLSLSNRRDFHAPEKKEETV